MQQGRLRTELDDMLRAKRRCTIGFVTSILWDRKCFANKRAWKHYRRSQYRVVLVGG